MNRTLYEPQHLDFGASVSEFIERSILPRHAEIIDNKLIDRDIWIEAGKHGFLGLEVPEKFGGGEANNFR